MKSSVVMIVFIVDKKVKEYIARVFEELSFIAMAGAVAVAVAGMTISITLRSMVVNNKLCWVWMIRRITIFVILWLLLYRVKSLSLQGFALILVDFELEMMFLEVGNFIAEK